MVTNELFAGTFPTAPILLVDCVCLFASFCFTLFNLGGRWWCFCFVFVVAVLLFLGGGGGIGGVDLWGLFSLPPPPPPPPPPTPPPPPPPHLKLVWGLMHQWYGIFIWPWPIIIMLSLGSSSSTYLRYHERLNTSPRYTYQQQQICCLLKRHLSNRSILFLARFSSISGKPFLQQQSTTAQYHSTWNFKYLWFFPY